MHEDDKVFIPRGRCLNARCCCSWNLFSRNLKDPVEARVLLSGDSIPIYGWTERFDCRTEYRGDGLILEMRKRHADTRDRGGTQGCEDEHSGESMKIKRKP